MACNVNKVTILSCNCCYFYISMQDGCWRHACCVSLSFLKSARLCGCSGYTAYLCWYIPNIFSNMLWWNPLHFREPYSNRSYSKNWRTLTVCALTPGMTETYPLFSRYGAPKHEDEMANPDTLLSKSFCIIKDLDKLAPLLKVRTRPFPRLILSWLL